jgi:hypothetical protein
LISPPAALPDFIIRSSFNLRTERGPLRRAVVRVGLMVAGD